MKTTSLDRQTSVKQQLRCSPLELSDGPMACFVALQNVLELVGRVDCFICHPAELLLGWLLPAERQRHAPRPLALPGQHVVVLGGGGGLTRAVAIECVRRGADVTVLAAGAPRRPRRTPPLRARPSRLPPLFRRSELAASPHPPAACLASTRVHAQSRRRSRRRTSS